MPRAALLVGTVVVGAALLAPAGTPGGFGIASAAAAAQYYTRKKVNGRWVSGKFAKAGAGAAGPDAKAAAKPAPAAKPVAAAKPAAAKPVKHAAKPGKGARRVRFVEKKGFKAKARYAALPKFKPRVVLRPAATPGPATPSQAAASPAKAAQIAPPATSGSPVPPPSPSAVAPTVPVGAPVPPPVEPKSAEAALPPDRVIATASITPAPVVNPGAERMRSALEARARTMANEFGTFSVPLPEAAPTVQLSARSVTFDLQKGVRTIVFDDGSAITAPYDRSKASDLTGLKPAP